MDVLGYLAGKQLNLKPADARNVHVPCFFCNEDPNARGRLYINVDTDAEVPAQYVCFLCGAKGNIYHLKRHFGDEVGTRDLDAHTRTAILTSAVTFYQEHLRAFPEVVAYLRGPERGLTAHTILDRHLGYAPMEFVQDLADGTMTVSPPRNLFRHLRDTGHPTKDILATGLCQERNGKFYDSLRGMITIPYFVAGNPVGIRGRTWPFTSADFEVWEGPHYKPPESKYKTPPGNQARLYNTDACWNAEEIIGTEGEFDAMVLTQNGRPALGIPGATSWQDSWDDYFLGMRRIWLIFDRDQAGERGAQKLVERFGSKARRVHLSEAGTKCDPTQWFAQGHTAEEFDALVAQAAKGGLLLTVDEARNEFVELQGTPGIRFGWEALDTRIRPGLQPSQVMVVLAKTGGNKTILMLNLMHRTRTVPGQENLHILFISLEQTRGEWWDRARRIHRFYNLYDSEEDAAHFWRDQFFIIDRNRLTETQFRQALEDYIYQVGKAPDLIVLDYLGYYARSFSGEAYARTSDAIMSLKGICKDYRTAIITPHQVSRLGLDGKEFTSDVARDSGVVEETADFLITMWTPDNAPGVDWSARTGQFNFRIAKSRHGGRGAQLYMQFAPTSLVMLPSTDLNDPRASGGDPLAAQARREYQWLKENPAQTWEDVVERHLKVGGPTWRPTLLHRRR